MDWDTFKSRLDMFVPTMELSELSAVVAQLQRDFAILQQTYQQQPIHQLYDITAALSRAATLHEVVNVVVEKVLNPTGHHKGIIALLTENDTMAEAILQFGAASEVIERFKKIPLSLDAPITHTIRTGQPCWIETAEQYEAQFPEIFHTTHLQTGTNSLIALPLAVNGQVIGGMGISFKHASIFSADTRIFYLIVAGHCAIAIERARLYANIQQFSQLIHEKNQDLQQFAYIASHDLQEPLRKIRQFSDRLLESASNRLNTQELDYLNRMHSATQRMQQLIESLLSYSRVATHTIPFEPVDLNQVLHNVLSDLGIRILTTKAQIHFDTLPTVEADPAQMWQLFKNLVENALKFHRPNIVPEIHITCNHNDHHHQIAIRDNGIGFDEKDLEQIFLPFNRLHGRLEFEGAGMGLAICRRIVERHKGSLTATSTPGGGAIFTITLPIKQSDAPSKATGFDKKS